MYYALGYEKSDFDKPMIGPANGHSTITPCNAGLQPLADAAAVAIKAAGANPQMLGTPTISDGMSMGTEGMKYSLVSREVIADCVEMSVQGQWMDGVLTLGGCDKNMPGGMPEKIESASESGRVLVEAVKKNIRPLDIVTARSIENAVALIMAIGGSTNAVPSLSRHRPCRRDRLDPGRFRARPAQGACDLRPEAVGQIHGRRPASSRRHPARAEDPSQCRHAAWRLPHHHRAHVADELAAVPGEPRADQRVIMPISGVLYREGRLAILKGNLAEDGAVAKITGLKSPAITCPARVFDDEQSAMEAILADRIRTGDVVVVRYLGPQGGPGMPEMLVPTSALVGRGLGESVA